LPPPPAPVEILRGWAAYGAELTALCADFLELLDAVAPACRERVAPYIPANSLDIAALLVRHAPGYRANKAERREPTAGTAPDMMLFDVHSSSPREYVIVEYLHRTKA
jgi:hypothetical protein